MDVNGTRFHLLYNEADWGQCFQDGINQPLGVLWAEGQAQGSGSATEDYRTAVVWDDTCQMLRLRRLSTEFRQARQFGQPLARAARRGAARDAYGNWYMIDDTRQRLLFRGYYGEEFTVFWDSQSPADTRQAVPPGTFQPKRAAPRAIVLSGLAVTTEHYLIVGWWDAPTTSQSESGLLVFDLHQGTLPTWIVWQPNTNHPYTEDFDPCSDIPPDVPADDPLRRDCVDRTSDFRPWDMAPTEAGGVVILDAHNQQLKARFWVLDRNLKVLSREELNHASPPDSSGQAETDTRTFIVNPFMSIDLIVGPEPDARRYILVMVKETRTTVIPVSGPGSVVLVYEELADNRYALTHRLYPLARVPDPELEEGRLVRIQAHDFVYVPPHTQQTQPGGLYMAEEKGNQLIAYDVDITALDAQEMNITLLARAEYIPLRRWSGRGLIYDGEHIYYDFESRWLRVQEFTSQNYARRAVILTPSELDPGYAFDSGLLNCTWHRLMLDASIPEGSMVTFRARAADDPQLLEVSAWVEQPVPYLRGSGAEIPFYRHPQLNASGHSGTWELLFQEIHGRYLQLEITLEGTGRITPAIYALRVWFPRFSYLEKYLPEIYRRDPFDTSFLERWLANFEGVLTNIEDHIVQVPRLLDARSAPAEALDWLSSWLGLVMDPAWKEPQRRFFIRYALEFYKWRGTVRGLEMMLHLYLYACDEELRADRFFHDPELFRSQIRIEESFIRQAFVPAPADADPHTPEYLEDIPGSAHRFVVLIPAELLTDETAAMVGRIVNLEKPAHTLVEYQLYGDRFRVGSALIGHDTLLDIPPDVREILLGTTRLPKGYLAPGYPENITDRLVTDRDSLGDLPAL
ncbi:MAG: hypothetical protein OHK0046_41790 [Anaerolineae bacterium]